MILPGTVHLGNASVFLEMNSAELMLSFANVAARDRFWGTDRFVFVYVCAYMYMTS